MNNPTRSFWQRALSIALGTIAGIIASAGTLAVAVSGFALSFDAMKAIAIAAYVRPSLAWLLPVTVDGAMSVATVVAVVLYRLRKPTWYPWLVVCVGASISIACNAMHAWTAGGTLALPREVAMAVSAVPPLLLALSIHLLVTLIDAVAHPIGQPECTRTMVGTDVPLDESTVRTDVRPNGTLVAAMTRVFREHVAAGNMPDARTLADLTGADPSHARRVHKRLVAALPAT